jgi:hypothetical protein
MRLHTPTSQTGFLMAALLGLSLTTGCGSGRKVPGLENFSAAVRSGNLYVGFVATTLQLDGCASFPIPGVPGATLGCAPQLQGKGTVFQLSIPLMSVLGGGQTFTQGGLPDGRALPEVSGGILPRWTENFTSLEMTLYTSNEAFGFFIPIPLKSGNGTTLPFIVSIRIEDERGNLIGKAFAIPPNARGEGTGIFVLLPYLGKAAQRGTAVRLAPDVKPN